ncbi:hypothetical protein A6R68_24082, partial [Neotoma lepida]
MIYNEGDVEKCKEDAIFNRVPYLECRNEELLNGVRQLKEKESPRIVKTHLPPKLLPASFWEKNCKDIRREVIKLIEFLGKKPSEELLNKIIQHTSFQEMKNNPFTNYTTMPENMMNHKVSSFMRKGIVGDWKNNFTVALREKFDEHYEQQMKEFTLKFREEL